MRVTQVKVSSHTNILFTDLFTDSSVTVLAFKSTYTIAASLWILTLYTGVDYEYMKQTHGWWKLSHMWLSRNLSGHIITPPRDIVPHIFADWLMAVEMKERAFGSVAPHTMSVVVASDFHVLATMAELRGLRQAATIPFLHGLLITKQELQDYMNNRSPQASDAGVAPPHMMLTKLQEDTAMVKDLVLGIGPDQSGSRPLAYLLGLQLEFSDWEASGEKSVLSYLTPVACEAVVGALLAQVRTTSNRQHTIKII